MREFVSVVLCFTFFVSTSIAQSDSQALLAGTQAIADRVAQRQSAPEIPTALYECDKTQCEDPNSGGALWLLDGKEGQGMWLYQAVAKLTVVAFDGRTIHIHRADPVGTYSSQFVKGAEWYADYYGTISGNRIEGQVVYFGNGHPDTWRATIVNGDFCTERAGKCPLNPDQLSVLGRRAAEAKMYAAAFRCFELAAARGDADGEGFLATMMMNGWGEKLTPAQIMALLKDSAGHDSYAGEKGLAQAYGEGVIVPKDPKQAAYWNDRASTWQGRKEAQENAQWQGRVLGPLLIVALLVAAASGDSAGQDEASGNRNKQLNMARGSCAAGDVGACHSIGRYDWSAGGHDH
jgi:hypothetical protein